MALFGLTTITTELIVWVGIGDGTNNMLSGLSSGDQLVEGTPRTNYRL